MFEFEKKLFRYISNSSVNVEHQEEYTCELSLHYGKDNPDILMERHYFFSELNGRDFHSDYKIVIKSNKGGYSFYKVEYSFDDGKPTVKGELELKDIKYMLELSDSISSNVDIVTCINNKLGVFGYRVEKISGEEIDLFNPQNNNRIIINRNGVVWAMFENMSDKLYIPLKEIYGYLYEGDDFFIEDGKMYDKLTIDNKNYYREQLQNQCIEIYKDIVGNVEIYMMSFYPIVVERILNYANALENLMAGKYDDKFEQNSIYSFLSLFFLKNNVATENNSDKEFVIALKELYYMLSCADVSRCDYWNCFVKILDMTISDKMRKIIFDILVSQIIIQEYYWFMSNKSNRIEWQLVCDMFYKIVEKYDLDPSNNPSRINIINYLERIV